MTHGMLYIVATPIGNLEDITYRAVTILREVDTILAEDTRVTKKLCERYDIDTPLVRFASHERDEKVGGIIKLLLGGRSMAVVSDAGTPGVSDPGVFLVERAVSAGITVVPVPGPSAITTLFSVAGVSGNTFYFKGFVPTKKGRQTFFVALSKETEPVMFFESVHRIEKTLEALQRHVPEAYIVIGRELTKLHEEVLRGTAREHLAYFEDHPDHMKGEFVLLVDNR